MESNEGRSKEKRKERKRRRKVREKPTMIGIDSETMICFRAANLASSVSVVVHSAGGFSTFLPIIITRNFSSDNYYGKSAMRGEESDA